jgi:carbonic anhydrase
MALPNILALDAMLEIKEIMVVKHTDCGSQKYTTEGVKTILKERAPAEDDAIGRMNLGSIAGKTLEQGLEEQILAVKSSPLVREDLKQKIRAFIFDLTVGDLKEVGG